MVNKLILVCLVVLTFTTQTALSQSQTEVVYSVSNSSIERFDGDNSKASDVTKKLKEQNQEQSASFNFLTTSWQSLATQQTKQNSTVQPNVDKGQDDGSTNTVSSEVKAVPGLELLVNAQVLATKIPTDKVSTEAASITSNVSPDSNTGVNSVPTLPEGVSGFVTAEPVVPETIGVPVTPPATPVPPAPKAAPPPAPTVAGLPLVYQVGVISQEDRNQYLSDAQFYRWRTSACSAASITSLLVAYGIPIKLGDVLNLMRDDGTIDPWIGLANNNGFEPLAEKFKLHANIDKNQDVDAHFNSIMASLRAHQPVIVNVKDGYLYPQGHFVVAFNVNSAGYVGIMDPDWHGKYAPGLQAWTIDELKNLFSGARLSVTFFK